MVDGERLEGTTKNGRTRIVSIDEETVTVLCEQHKAQAADKLRVGESWKGEKNGHVFTTGWGEPIFPDTVSSLPSKLIHSYNNPEEGEPPAEPLPHVRLHDLRHVHATTLLLAGVPVHVVAARLGHSDPAITLRVYAHVVRAAEASAVGVFAKTITAA